MHLQKRGFTNWKRGKCVCVCVGGGEGGGSKEVVLASHLGRDLSRTSLQVDMLPKGTERRPFAAETDHRSSS